MAARSALAVTVALGLPAAPLFGEAQRADKVAWIGILSAGTSDDTSPRFEVFRQGVRDLGYVDGRNIAIETRWGVTAERLAVHAAGLVDQKVDVIVATSPPAALAVRKRRWRRRRDR
jgi:putative ABC transport system substrate-binding protein